MIDRERPNAATRWGPRLMTPVDAVSEAGSSPWRLAVSGATADHRHSEAGHPGNPGLTVEQLAERADNPFGSRFEIISDEAEWQVRLDAMAKAAEAA